MNENNGQWKVPYIFYEGISKKFFQILGLFVHEITYLLQFTIEIIFNFGFEGALTFDAERMYLDYWTGEFFGTIVFLKPY